MSDARRTFRSGRNSAQSSIAATSPKLEAAKTSIFTGGNVSRPLTTSALMTASARTAPLAQKKTAKIRGTFMNVLTISLKPSSNLPVNQIGLRKNVWLGGKASSVDRDHIILSKRE